MCKNEKTFVGGQNFKLPSNEVWSPCEEDLLSLEENLVVFRPHTFIEGNLEAPFSVLDLGIHLIKNKAFNGFVGLIGEFAYQEKIDDLIEELIKLKNKE